MQRFWQTAALFLLLRLLAACNSNVSARSSGSESVQRSSLVLGLPF